MKRVLNDPLLHFLLLGTGIFVFFSVTDPPTSSEHDRIIITQGHVEHLAMSFVRSRQRPPSSEEMEGLIQDYLIEEVYYREAIALGLDKDDTVIRRRLRQKMESIADGLIAQAEPTDNDLLTYLAKHQGHFEIHPRFSFRHVYIKPKRRGENLHRDTTQMLSELRQAGSNADSETYGDPFLLPLRFDNTSADEIQTMFGEEFISSLSTISTGEWHGPFESGFGSHLVLVTERIPGRTPDFEEVRDQVRTELMNATRVEASRKFLEELLHRYTVTVGSPARERETSEAG